MDLLGIRVKHITLGVGTVTLQDTGYVIVEFMSKTSKFEYPFAFLNFLTADNVTMQASILKEIEDAKVVAEEKKFAEVAVQKRVKEATAKRIGNKPTYTTRLQRPSGKSMVFFVFQGTTFKKESRSGYLWAPITNMEGSNVHHWNRLLDVRSGDIILHGCDGYVAAISTARCECYECPKPDELGAKDLWDRDGRRIDCDYIVIQHPIKTANYKDEILNHSAAKYSPFDKDGNGNMGYLYEINRDLARIFVRESSNANEYLLDYEFISDFLNEALF